MAAFDSPGDSIITSGGNIVGVDLVRKDVPNSNQGGNTIVYEGYTPEACTLSEITVFMKTLNTQGAYTVTFTNVTTGNTVLSTANFNMQTLSANTWTTLTLTGTASDLSFAADDRFRISFASNNASFDGSGIYFTMRFTASSSFTPRAMDLLFSTTLTGTQTTISTGTLPTGYRDLVIRGVLRCDRALNGDTFAIILNGDTNASNYQYIRIYGQGSVALHRNLAGHNERVLGFLSAGAATAGSFNAFTLTIYNHERTDNFKQYLTQYGAQTAPGTSNDNEIGMSGGQRRVTDAITTVGFDVLNSDFVSGSSIAVYGVR